MIRLYSNSSFIIVALLAGINLILAIYCIIRLSSRGDTERLSGLDRGIDGILFISLCMLFFTFMMPFYDMFRAFGSIAHSGPGDPGVVVQGILDLLVPTYVNLGFFSLFMIVWFALRTYHRMKMDRAIP